MGQRWYAASYSDQWMYHGWTMRGWTTGERERERGSIQGLNMQTLFLCCNCYPVTSLTLAPGGCLSDGQGSRHCRGLLEQVDIPLIVSEVGLVTLNKTYATTPAAVTCSNREWMQVIVNQSSQNWKPKQPNSLLAALRGDISWINVYLQY